MPPLLLIGHLQNVQEDFQLRIWIGKAIDSIGLSWGLRAPHPGFHTLIVSPSAQEMNIWRDGEYLATWSCHSLDDDLSFRHPSHGSTLARCDAGFTRIFERPRSLPELEAFSREQFVLRQGFEK